MKQLRTLCSSVLFVLFALPGLAGEVWVSPIGSDTGPGPHGAGTAKDPYRVKDSQQFDRLMMIIAPSNTIRLQEGLYRTDGILGVAQFGVQMKDGWKVRGAGTDSTTIRINAITNPPNPLSYWSILGGRQNSSASGATHDAEVSDLTVDMNVQAHAQGVRFGAVLLGGHNTRISRVKVCNWGSTVKIEQFLLVINQHVGGVWQEIMTNCVIEDCIIAPPAMVPLKGGTTAIAIVGKPVNESVPGPGWIADAVIRGCFASGVKASSVGGIGQPEYFQAFGMGSTINGRITNNVALDLDGPSSAAYWECDSNLDFGIVNNTFLNVNIGIHLRGEVCPSPAIIRKGLVFRDNLITTRPGGYGIIFGGNAGISTPTELLITGNTIHAKQGSSHSAVYLRHASRIAVDGNILDAGVGGTDVFIGPGVSGVFVTNNAKLMGKPIVVQRPSLDAALDAAFQKIQAEFETLRAAFRGASQ